MKYETVIGLEVHVELHTKTKLFCGCENRFGGEPNFQVCPVCLGLPGSLPVINREAVRKHVLAALALNCKVPRRSKFDRKNYFYPDMPKDYQISQYDLPLAVGGRLAIEDENGDEKFIGITRIHLEEDTGKSKHAGETGSIAASDYTLLDYNRAGVPLMEIVSEPDMRSPEEAYRYLTGLKRILTWLGVSDCKMEEGSLRCDANVSLRKVGAKNLGVKTEIKNMNSFKGVRAALEYEVKRHLEILDDGGRVVQETRGWEEARNVTIPMRSKEEAHDYRYFPEPDLTPLNLSEKWIDDLKSSLPEMPQEMSQRLVMDYGIPEYDAGVITGYREFADFFENAVKRCGEAKQVSNWMMGDILKYLNANEMEIRQSKLTPEALGKMIKMISDGEISGKIGKKLVEELLKKGGDPEVIVEKKGWKQVGSPEKLMPMIKEAIDGNPKVLEQYLDGKESTLGFFVGQVMKKTRGKADPKVVNRLLSEELGKRKKNQQ